MDLSLLDKSADVTPLIVDLYDNHQLYALAKDKDPQARLALTDAITELLETKTSEREAELIADILISLTRQAEQELRQTIAERLCVMPNVPLRLILQLANDEIEIASPVLRHSTVLGDLDLIYIIKSKGADYWRAIAGRQNLSAQVVDMLAGTKDAGTGMVLLANENITLTENALTILSDMARERNDMAIPLLRREEVTRDIAAKLYRFVGEEIKAYIKAHYSVEIDHHPADNVAEDAIREMEAGLQGSYRPGAIASELARQHNERGTLTFEMMEQTLRRGQIASFVAQFSEYADIGADALITLITHSKGAGLAVACRAAELDKSEFTSLYLLTNAMRSKARLVDMRDLGQVLDYFDNMTAAKAREIINQL